MKISPILPLLAAAFCVLSLNSCVMPFDEYPPGGYGSGYYGGGYSSAPVIYNRSSTVFYDDAFSYYDGGYQPYWTQPTSYYSVGYSYYRGHGSCPICHHSPCSGHHGRPASRSYYGSSSHYDHDDHRGGFLSRSYQNRDDHHSSTSRSGHVLYERSGRSGPTGAHSLDWYHDHGYTASQLRRVDDDHHSSSSHKKDNDDRRKR